LNEVVDDLDVGQTLLIGTNFIGAFDDEDALVSKDPVSFGCSLEVQVQDGFVVLSGRGVGGGVVPIVLFVVLVIDVRGTAGRMHIGWIEYDAVDRGILVG